MDSEGGFVSAFSALMLMMSLGHLMMSLGKAVHVDGDFLTWNANSQETWKENGTQADHKEKTTNDLRLGTCKHRWYKVKGVWKYS